jgi:hypothetical protein
MKNKIIIILLIILSNQAFGQFQITKLDKVKPVFGYIDSAHTQEINTTRKIYGSDDLKRDSKLDSLALLRCLRYANLVIKDTRYFTDDDLLESVIHKECTGLYAGENATQSPFPAGFAEYQFNGLTKEIVTPKINNKKYIPGIQYNKSDKKGGHRDNRINEKYKKFGSAIVIIYVMIKNPDYDPNSISVSLEFYPTAIFINYEVFDY